MEKQVEIVEIASFFYKFIYIFPCFFAFPKPNTSIGFRLANTLKLLLTNSPLPLKPSDKVNLLL